ncbi:hypothetical protein D0867_04205 [Hortaea werneckii]|uniref:Uncharacterized protein n=1 Tax=Hortaea werneckii TaxID=91943 RepID=A0A3M6ZXW0_HORWE|nr:hypothetical protein D0867_04205 [Hortaea werneckii]RMY35789.1 hypothetical protein D0866_04371 [Hortaea werneckii]
MGIPYSKEINQAFDQVAPLVAATLDVLQTSKNITYLLAAVQVLNAVLLLVAVVSLLGLLITVNPDLAEERRALVTPVVKRLASWLMPGSEGRWYLRVIAWSVATVWLVGCTATAYYAMRENDRKYWDDSTSREPSITNREELATIERPEGNREGQVDGERDARDESGNIDAPFQKAGNMDVTPVSSSNYLRVYRHLTYKVPSRFRTPTSAIINVKDWTARSLQKSDIIHDLLLVCRPETRYGITTAMVLYLGLDIELKPETISIPPSSQVYLCRTRNEGHATNMLPITATDRHKPLKPRV